MPAGWVPPADYGLGWLYEHQPGTAAPVWCPQEHAAVFARLEDVTARLRATYPDQFKTQADDPDGLAARLWDQR